MAYKHVLHKLDCECGFEMFVLDREKSSSEVKPYQIDLWRKAAKEMNRQFVDSNETKNCSQCGRVIDLTQQPDEKYQDDGEKLNRVG